MVNDDEVPSIEDIVAQSFAEMTDTTSVEDTSKQVKDDAEERMSSGRYVPPIHAKMDQSVIVTPATEGDKEEKTVNDTSHVVAQPSAQIGDEFDVDWGKED